ncbi:unnamed protein product, partial [Discosporangium mesarthrocarpum]
LATGSGRTLKFHPASMSSKPSRGSPSGNGGRVQSPGSGQGLGVGFQGSVPSKYGGQGRETRDAESSLDGQSLIAEGVSHAPADTTFRKHREKSWQILAPLVANLGMKYKEEYGGEDGNEDRGVGDHGMSTWDTVDVQDFQDVWEELEFSGHNLTSVLNNPRETFIDSLYEPFEAEQHYPLTALVESPPGHVEVTLQVGRSFFKV